VKNKLGISLFTGAGIGDLGFRSAGIEFVCMNELEVDRSSLAQLNFPAVDVVTGDAWDRWKDAVAVAEEQREDIFFVSCTAPCQGMSKSGKGKLLREVREGRRPKLDLRNRLILPALEAIRAIRPQWVFFENVSEMANTVIEDEAGELVFILDLIERELGSEYVGAAYNLEFADYGVPQRRRRLLTIYTRSEPGRSHLDRGGRFVPDPTHASRPSNGLLPWVSVSSALEKFPPLDASSKDTAMDESVPFHRVPLLDSVKYEWVRQTPAGCSAFDNQCTSCGYDENTIHGAKHDRYGVNRSITTTPILCEKCGALLPRPYVLDSDGKPRIMRGYTSSYKRMQGDLPAPTLTRNVSYACSDQKVHPVENRVLSLAEAFRVHTLDRYEYSWGPVETKRGAIRDVAPDSLIRLALGESIPPFINEIVMNHIIKIEEGSATLPPNAREMLPLQL
jgi:DNA (cytosine-5)-methyltransferase 1